MALSASQQALLQLGAGFLANPTGNFARNAGMAIGPALETYRAGRTQEMEQATLDAKRQEALKKARIEALKYQLGQISERAAANGGTDLKALETLGAQKQAVQAQLGAAMGVPELFQGAGIPAGPSAARTGPSGGVPGAPQLTMTDARDPAPPQTAPVNLDRGVQTAPAAPAAPQGGLAALRRSFPGVAMDLAKLRRQELAPGVTTDAFGGDLQVIPQDNRTMVVPDGSDGWRAVPNPAYIAASRQMEADKGAIELANRPLTITTDQGSQIQTTFGQAGGTRGGVQITPIRSVEGENEGLRIAGQDFYGKFVPNLLRENKGLQGQISTLQAMRDMLDTGISSGGAELRPYLQGFRDVLAFVTGNEQLTTATSVEGLFAQLATSGALDILASQPGVKTDFEFRVAQSVMPNLTDSAEQNKFRIAFMQAQAQRLITFNQRVVNLAQRNKDPNDRLFNTMDSTEIMNTAAASMESLLEMPELKAYQDYMRQASKRLGGTL